MFLSLSFFSISLILVYLSSQALISRLNQFFLRLTKSPSLSLNLLFFLFLPGIFLHEFSHILAAEILRVPTGRIDLKPELKDDRLKFGSAQIAVTDPLRLTLIGTAPFLTGLLSLWVIIKFGFQIDLTEITLSVLFSHLRFIFTQISPILLVIYFYLIISISNTMFSSASDLQAAAFPVILIIIIVAIFQLTSLNLPLLFISFITNLSFLVASLFCMVLVINLLLLLPLILVTNKA